MNASRRVQVIAWVLSGLLALAFVVAGLPKVFGASVWIAKFAAWGYPRWSVAVVGLLEVGGGVLLLVPKAARYAVILLLVIMAGAAWTHLANGEGLQVLRPLIYAATLGGVGWLRSRDRR